MTTKRINEFPEGNSTITSDDLFLIMDDPSGNAATKTLSLSSLLELPRNSAILNLGSISGSNAINFGLDRLIQTLTLSGVATTFTKGTGWPSTDNSKDIVLQITVSSNTSITWSIVTDWYRQPPAGALTIGTHLFLLRAMGSSIIQGHYIGNKTN